MNELQLIVDLVFAVLAAFVGGVVAQRLGQPVILGYLLAGVALGPFTPGPTADVRSVQVLAEMGVAFLMFALGAEFSLGELRRVGRTAGLGGILQIAISLLIGPLLARFLGLSFTQGLFVGALLALSSTVVVLKILMARGEQQSLHGRVALGILIAQDLAVVPMVVLLPALVGGSTHVLTDLVIAVAKAAGIIAVSYLVGVRAVPWLLSHASVSRTREVFVLGVVALALGTALLTEFAGLSLAFGAFLAGLVVAESEYRTQVIAEVLPLRDLFVALFFVSVGMLVNPIVIARQIGLLIPLLLAVIVVKVFVGTLVVLLLGMPGRAALLTGLSLAQVGEFSFVLAKIGVDRGAIPSALFDLTLALALITIVLTPALLRAAPALLRGIVRLPGVRANWIDPIEEDVMAEGMRRHVVICGYGRVGRELADALAKRELRYVIVEYNPAIVRELRKMGAPVIYGDAANPVVLEHANVGQASLLTVLVPDAVTVERAVQNARTLNPSLRIIARAAQPSDVERLRRAGAHEVVQPEFEAGVEVIRLVLRRYGISDRELSHLLAGRRTAFYEQPREP